METLEKLLLFLSRKGEENGSEGRVSGEDIDAHFGTNPIARGMILGPAVLEHLVVRYGNTGGANHYALTQWGHERVAQLR